MSARSVRRGHVIDLSWIERWPARAYRAGEHVTVRDRALCVVDLDLPDVTGRQLRLRLQPGLATTCTRYATSPAQRLSLTAPGYLVLQWRIEGWPQALGTLEQRSAFAYLSYIPRGRSLDFDYVCGAWMGAALFGTPRAFEQRWGMGAALTRPFGCDVDGIAELRTPRRRALRLTGAAFGALSSLVNDPWDGPLLRASVESRLLALLCGTLYAAEPESVAPLAPRDLDLLRRVRTALARDPGAAHTLNSVSARFGLSRATLARRFKAAFGETFYACLQRERLQLASELLAGGRSRVADVARRVGYRDPASFTRAFHAHFGCVPRAVARGAPSDAAGARRAAPLG